MISGIPAPDRTRLLILAITVVALKALLTTLGGFEMHYDEAQYWEWSRQLDWSYYSKGPLVAWSIAASEALFGHGEWQARLPGWLIAAVWLLLLYRFAFDAWGNRRAAWWAVILGLSTPVWVTLGMVITTDVFLLFFWTWCLWAAWRAVQGQSRAWHEVGMAIGLGALTKLSIGLLPFFGGLLIIAVPGWRHHLRDRELWQGLLVMVLLMLPVLGWNAMRDWVMFRHEMGHVTSRAWSGAQVLEFVITQLLVLSPLVVLAVLGALGWQRVERRLRFVWLVSMACLLFFVWKATGGKVQVNWLAPVYIGFLIIAVGRIAAFSALRSGLLYVGIAFSAVLVLVVLFPSVVGLGVKQDPFRQMKVWREPVAALAAQLPAADFLLVPNYKLAASLAFYWPYEMPVYVAPSVHRRYNQHDLWPSMAREQGGDALYISTGPGLVAHVPDAFDSCREVARKVVHNARGETLRTLYVSYCQQYRPIDWPRPGRY